MLLTVLYWVILVLCMLGVVVISPFENYHYWHDGALLALLIIIGLRSFRTEVK